MAALSSNRPARIAIVIASQSIISGSYSPAWQAVQLSFWPCMNIVIYVIWPRTQAGLACIPRRPTPAGPKRASALGNRLFFGWRRRCQFGREAYLKDVAASVCPHANGKEEGAAGAIG
jgi:hypothetical protein